MKFGFVTIENGVLRADIDRVTVWSKKATRRNAKKLGAFMAGHSNVNWRYSSSIDDPHENGGPRINFRVAIAEGANAEVFDPINHGDEP